MKWHSLTGSPRSLTPFPFLSIQNLIPVTYASSKYTIPSVFAFLGLLVLAPVVHAEECPVTKAALISTAGNNNGLGSLSQAFVVPPGYETISDRMRFLSNEWPTWYGTQYNDTYLVRLTAPGKAKVLASGNVNSSTWSSGASGFNGKTPEKNFTMDVSALVGKVANIYYEVRDVGDLVVDSGWAIDAIKVVRTQQ